MYVYVAAQGCVCVLLLLGAQGRRPCEYFCWCCCKQGIMLFATAYMVLLSQIYLKFCLGRAYAGHER